MSAAAAQQASQQQQQIPLEELSIEQLSQIKQQLDEVRLEAGDTLLSVASPSDEPPHRRRSNT